MIRVTESALEQLRTLIQDSGKALRIYAMPG